MESAPDAKPVSRPLASAIGSMVVTPQAVLAMATMDAHNPTIRVRIVTLREDI